MKKMLVAAVLSCISAGVHAEGHYVPGIEGVKAASVPPAGNYYIGYAVNYDFDKVKDNSGNSAAAKGKVTALAHRFVHMTTKKVLGADYGVEAIVPMINKDFDFANSSSSGIGDVYVGPVVLAWHGERWDTVGAAGVWLDNGSTSKPSSPGNGYKGTMLTGGGTVYLNADKSLSASGLARYEINGKKDSGFEPGDQATLEWGVGKKVNDTTELGLVGYEQWQTTKDKGTGASNNKSSKHALGLEASRTVKSLGGILKAGYYNEYSVKGGTNPSPTGSTFRVNFVKPF